jgi:hypothetical protein
MKNVKLAGPKRYNHGGELFEAGQVYRVDDKRAEKLLASTDPSTGYPYFSEAPDTAPAVAPVKASTDEVKAPRRERPIIPVAKPRLGRPRGTVVDRTGAEEIDTGAAAAAKSTKPVDDDDATDPTAVTV